MVNGKPKDVIELADLIAQDLVTYAERNGLTPAQLVQTAVMVERLITRTFPGPEEVARLAVLEAHATFNAMVQPVVMNN